MGSQEKEEVETCAVLHLIWSKPPGQEGSSTDKVRWLKLRKGAGDPEWKRIWFGRCCSGQSCRIGLWLQFGPLVIVSDWITALNDWQLQWQWMHWHTDMYTQTVSQLGWQPMFHHKAYKHQLFGVIQQKVGLTFTVQLGKEVWECHKIQNWAALCKTVIFLAFCYNCLSLHINVR